MAKCTDVDRAGKVDSCIREWRLLLESKFWEWRRWGTLVSGSFKASTQNTAVDVDLYQTSAFNDPVPFPDLIKCLSYPVVSDSFMGVLDYKSGEIVVTWQ